MAARDRELAAAIARAVRDFDRSLVLYGLAGSELIRAGRDAGIAVANEVFADRTYQPDGRLTPRSRPDALIHDVEISLAQVKRMVQAERSRRSTAASSRSSPIPCASMAMRRRLRRSPRGSGPSWMRLGSLCGRFKPSQRVDFSPLPLRRG